MDSWLKGIEKAEIGHYSTLRFGGQFTVCTKFMD